MKEKKITWENIIDGVITTTPTNTPQKGETLANTTFLTFQKQNKKMQFYDVFSKYSLYLCIMLGMLIR